eukprot:755642-Hanusia_phi.AAC.7
MAGAVWAAVMAASSVMLFYSGFYMAGRDDYGSYPWPISLVLDRRRLSRRSYSEVHRISWQFCERTGVQGTMRFIVRGSTSLCGANNVESIPKGLFRIAARAGVGFIIGSLFFHALFVIFGVPGAAVAEHGLGNLQVVGTWFGAIPIPLDWDRPWQVQLVSTLQVAQESQAWPITCTAGAIAGHALGCCAALGRADFQLRVQLARKRRRADGVEGAFPSSSRSGGARTALHPTCTFSLQLDSPTKESWPRERSHKPPSQSIL